MSNHVHSRCSSGWLCTCSPALSVALYKACWRRKCRTNYAARLENSSYGRSELNERRASFSKMEAKPRDKDEVLLGLSEHTQKAQPAAYRDCSSSRTLLDTFLRTRIQVCDGCPPCCYQLSLRRAPRVRSIDEAICSDSAWLKFHLRCKSCSCGFCTSPSSRGERNDTRRNDRQHLQAGPCPLQMVHARLKLSMPCTLSKELRLVAGTLVL